MRMLACLLAGILLAEGSRGGAAPLSQKAPPGWQRTGERFVDDATGKTVEVFYDPKPGDRQYVDRG